MSRKHKRPIPRTPVVEQAPATPVGDLTLIIAELTVEYATLERYTWHLPGRTKTERREHKTSGRGLLQQLAEAAGVRDDDPEVAANTAAVRQDEGGHSKPGSRLPAGSLFVDEYARLTTEVWAMRARLAKGQGIRWLPGGHPADALTDILNLVVRAPRWQQEQTVRAARSWASAARVALQYEAPWAELRSPCPDCGGVLKVRADATSDVWCRGGPLVAVPWHPDGCGNRWPRATWLTLLVDLNQKAAP